MKKFVCAAVVSLVAFSFALAEEFTAYVTKIGDGKITLQKFKFNKEDKKVEKSDAKEYKVAADAKVIKGGKFDKDTKKFTGGDVIEGGLKNEMFAADKLKADMGVVVRVTTDDKDNITEIRSVGKGGGKKKKKDTN